MRDMLHAGQLSGHQSVVVGAGASGRAAARLLSRLGASVRFLEKNAASVTDAFRAEAVEAGYDLRVGDHGPADFAGADLVVLSPGIRAASLTDCLAACPGAQVVSELELASWFTAEPIVAVTGSNGKTTTVMLISHLLEAAGRKVFTGGNIGTPLSEYVLAGDPADVVVLEVSSFQLQLVRTFRPRVGVLLNFSPNHLDWHADLDEYLDAKLNLFKAQRPGDLALVPEELRETLAGRTLSKGEVVWFAPSGRFHCPRLAGLHNRQNMEAAYLACQPFGVTEETAKAAFESFAPAPHRLQIIGEKRGVLFVDDSKATTVAAMEAALKSFDRPVRLLCGGVWKGGDLAALLPLLKGKVASVGLFGASREIFEAAWAGQVPLFYEPTQKAAVTRLFAEAVPGDVILLSPATASFDLYDSYKARGRDFQEIFAGLPMGPAGQAEGRP
ncbi:UDP-N-acetylmuramoylalanine/D-glutamate ligase [Solidesulfovibrio carbinoliphilus subsp. oakridgensis]|uniref:UDP-N-acetylmuramoylalanine--D-glutamate ligase n=1 Tax=Solidesulfovibrio carbinoliphilus subsp. oakridgensis TaxID=694327 RepID=G7Q4S6_9BACT|nr:UDP-N-acetylmuramoyl-L-alanine--D-glutamate ligase [Solidesulfovibrio carbinoliphilus]EHJ47536.1 UDP-N-acetylmuramoylalanine/D-glutamate ligase [Solidesulfovibrio carbinoliphilus subsp. oakridgensis]